MIRRPTRRSALALGAGLAALAAAPALADDAQAPAPAATEDKGYALGDVIQGDPDAPVTIIEYASFTCPHCAHFQTATFPEIKARYIDTGKAKLILREVYFDQFGLWSGMIARCGGEMNYYRLADAFLERQKTWFTDNVPAYRQNNDPQPILAGMMRIGRLAGLSDERMEACLSDQSLLESMVEHFQTTAKADGVDATPTFFVNGEKVEGAVSPDAMSAAIEKALAAGG